MPEPPESAPARDARDGTPATTTSIPDGPGVSRAVPRDLHESTLTMRGHERRAVRPGAGMHHLRGEAARRVKVALVTAAAARDIDDDLPPLMAALDVVGVTYALVDWDDPGVHWEGFDLAMVRSIWDYTRRRDEMLAWADRVAALTDLANPPPVLAWSSDKRYLADLAAAGVPVVPTVFAAPGETMDWPAGEIVVKPTVSAGSIDTDRYTEAERGAAEEHVARLHADGRTAMAQPYLSAVEGERGETALVYVGGAFSHAARKGPMLIPGLAVVGDLFVEEDIRPATATAAELAVGAQALAAVPGGAAGLLYARVDLVPGPDGAPVLLELELVEPSLFVAHVPGTAEHVAEVIAARIGRARRRD